MSPLILSLIQISLVLSLAPMSVGGVRWFKARLQGRHGAVPWLPYITYANLLKKENVISSTGSWMLHVTPYAVLGSNIFLALVLPLVSVGGSLTALSNFIVVAAVLLLSSTFLVMGAFDAGSAFGGLGGSRAITLAALFEPTIILTFIALVLATGSSTLDGVISGQVMVGGLLIQAPYLVLSWFALMLTALAETARYPVDEPGTQLELTMMHEATVFDYSGPYLAMLEYASALKLTVFVLLLANLILPWPILVATSSGLTVFSVILATLLKLLVVMFVIALLESSIARVRLYRIQEFLTSAFFMALGGVSLALLSRLI